MSTGFAPRSEERQIRDSLDARIHRHRGRKARRQRNKEIRAFIAMKIKAENPDMKPGQIRAEAARIAQKYEER